MRYVPLLTLATVIAAGTAFPESASPWPPAADIAWDCEYTGDVLPEEADPAWAGSPSEKTSAAVENGALHVSDPTSEAGSLCRFTRGWRVDPEQGGVVEARIQLISNTAHGGAGLMLADGVHETHLTLYPDRIEINEAEVVHPMNPVDGFHVYRIAARGTDLLVWVDGALVIDAPGKHAAEAHSGRKHVSFGSGSSKAQSEALYDYVRVASLGDIPLPERVAGAEDVIIYKEPGVYACFPSLYELDDGTLVTSFGTRTRRSHIDPTGGSACYVSHDRGRTWTPHEGPRPIDPAHRCADGSYVNANAFGWREVPAERRAEFESQDITVRAVRDGVVAYLQGAFVSRSADGQDWMREELALPAHRSLMTYGRVDRKSLPEGLHVMPVYGALKEDPKESGRTFLLRSADDGKTWWFLPLAAAPDEEVRLNETALAANTNGELVAMIRSEPPEGGHLYVAISADTGITWAPAQQTNIWGYPAHLLLLSDGRMLCTYGYRRDPMGVRAVISADGGRTWDAANERIIRCDGMGNGADLGYPISVESEPGRIFTIYYMTTDDNVTHVAGTHWPLPPA